MAQLDVARIKQRASGLFDGFTRGQKTTMGIAGVAVLVGLYLFAGRGGTTDMAALYTGLDANDASAITSELSAQGVGYELAANGSTIMVPRSEVYDLRLTMSAQGLPAGGSAGYELLDSEGITTSKFKQQVNYQRALEGELARTIEHIDGVEAATVHLVIPTDDIFAGDDRKATGAVLVQTAANRSLDAMQVEAITNLVASSVEGLSPELVTVTDQRGTVLSAPGEDNLGAAVGDMQLRQQAAYETTLAQQLEALAANVVGPGKVDVKVAATLNFDQKASVTETYRPPEQEAGTTPLKETETVNNEVFSGSNSAGTVGVLGEDGTPTGTDTGQQSYQKTESATDFAIDKTTDEIREAPGKVEKLSVAVFIDKDSVDEGDIATIEETLATAAGIDTSRGDEITVNALAFDTTTAEAAQAELEAASSANAKAASTDLIRTVAAVVIVLLILFFSWRSLKKAAKRARSESTPLDLRELENLRLKLDALGPAGSDLVALGPGEFDERGQLVPLEASSEDRLRQQVEDEVGDLIDKQPDEVARLLRSWLAERRTAKR